MSANFKRIKRRLKTSVAARLSLDFAIREELRLASRESPRVAMAMVIAALCMPDESHPTLDTRPVWTSLDRALIQVNEVVFAIWTSGPRPQLDRREQILWVLSVNRTCPGFHPATTPDRDVAEFVGLSVMLRSGGLRRNSLKWVDLIAPPENYQGPARL